MNWREVSGCGAVDVPFATRDPTGGLNTNGLLEMPSTAP
jgi:hypothetical protein